MERNPEQSARRAIPDAALCARTLADPGAVQVNSVLALMAGE